MTDIAGIPQKDLVCIVDDDEGMRNAISRLLKFIGTEVRTYASPGEFLEDPRRHDCRCLILDMRMPQMSGLKLQAQLLQTGWTAPIIFLTGHADVPTVVEAMRSGAVDFLEKPFSDQKLLDRVQEALAQQRDVQREVVQHSQIEARLALLTPREQEVMTMLVDGDSSKTIADKLHISTRTVEDHRANILKKLRVPSVVVLVGVLSKIRRV
jgi:FixJ family two-component response regulator